MRKLLKRLRTRHEVRLAVQLYEHTNLSAGMNVAAHEAFARFARGFLGSGGLAFFAQNADGLFDVAIGFDQSGAAITEARVGPFPQFLHELGWNLHGRLLCTHPSFLKIALHASTSCRTARPRAIRGGPLDFPTHAACRRQAGS